MTPSSKDYFGILKKFIYSLSGPDVSFEPLRKGIYAISDDFHIAKILLSLDIMAKPPFIWKKHIEETLFEISEINPEGKYSFYFETAEPSSGEIICFPYRGTFFSEDDKNFLDVLLPFIQIYCGRYKMIQRAENEAFIQSATGLPNVNGYLKIAAEKKNAGILNNYTAFYFNIKNFGLVNKQFGQQEGTEILRRYTSVLLSNLEEDEVLAHLGGDNFVALIKKGKNVENFKKYLFEIEVNGVTFDGTEKTITLSSTAGCMDIDENCLPDYIVSGPAIAYNWAKLQKLPIVLLTDALSKKVNRDKMIEQNFKNALEKKEFIVYYQPKVNSISGKIIGTEALVRWYENGRIIPPIDFIPILEQSGKIIELDLYMLEQVCSDISNWKSKGNKSVPASINFSRKDLSDKNLVDKIVKIINKYGILKSEIVIEVTETTNEEEQGQMSDFLNKLKEYGIETSIDDFGTGYSSLSVLREFPVNEIKIDRSFINRDLDQPDEIIIKSIINMARELGINVITEGVEDIQQREFLSRLGCTKLQGYLYDKPLPKEEFEKRMKIGYYTV